MPGVLNPIVNINNVTNAVISGNKSISSGSFYWSITGEGGKIEATYTNYISSYNPNYKWGGASGGPIYFDGLSQYVTVNTEVSVTKYEIVGEEKRYSSFAFGTYKDANDYL
jgi:hypothetical protein